MRDEQPIPCEICGASALRWASIKGFQHWRCRACGHVFVFPRPAPAALDAFYQQAEYYAQAQAQSTRLHAEARARLERLEQLAARFGLARRLLDVGCATGIFLKNAVEAGWSAQGAERSHAIARKARASTGVEIRCGLLEQMELADAPFDVVTSWEVIEHSIDPRAFFSALSRNVAPGGILALSTPLADGIPGRVLGARFPMLCPPEHLSIFTRTSLQRLAGEFGFEPVHFRSFSNLGPLSIASGLARYACGAQFASLRAVSRATLHALGMATAWIPLLFDRAGRGSEMEMVFRK